MWQYYDFQSNNGDFMSVWNSVAVQLMLEDSLQCLCTCTSKYYYETMLPCEYSPEQNIWPKIIANKTHKHIIENALVQRFERQMRQAGISYPDKTILNKSFFKTCYKELYRDFIPTPSCYESCIVWGGERYMLPVMHMVARHLFPSDTIYGFVGTRGGNIVLALEQSRIVFDINGFYLQKHSEDGTIPSYYLNENTSLLDQKYIQSAINHLKIALPGGITDFQYQAYITDIYDYYTVHEFGDEYETYYESMFSDW